MRARAECHLIPVAALAALALSGCAELPKPPGVAPSLSVAADLRDEREEVVGVLIARWHTGLILPADGFGELRVLMLHDPAARYLSVGWGNRRFYTAANPGSGDAVGALFPSDSVLLVQTLAHAPDSAPAAGQLKWVCVDRAELERLDAYVSDSLRWQAGAPLELGPGPLPESRFYSSGAHYDAFHTCNTWTTAALQFAGLPVRAGGVLFAGQVARRIQALPACPAPAIGGR